jgi:HSP20 family protein
MLFEVAGARAPPHVGDDAVTATYDAGVLSVRVAGAYAGVGPPAHPGTAAAAPAIDAAQQRQEDETAA